MPVKPMKSSSVSRQMIALRHRLEYVQLEIERLAQRCDHAGIKKSPDNAGDRVRRGDWLVDELVRGREH